MTYFDNGDRVKVRGIDGAGTVEGSSWVYAFGGYGYEVRLDDGPLIIVQVEYLTLAPKEEPGIGEHFTDSDGQEFVHIDSDPADGWIHLVYDENVNHNTRRYYSWEEIRGA